MKKLIIIGSGRTVWDDLDRIIDWRSYDSMAINDAIMHFPERLDHAYSNDYIMLPKWVAARRPVFKDKDAGIKMHCCFACPGAIRHDIKVHGNSGICAAYAAMDMGYDALILCGIPQDNEGHYFDSPWERTNYENSTKTKLDHIRYWPKLKGIAFSMSGRTREVLGEPPSRICQVRESLQRPVWDGQAAQGGGI